MNKRFVRAAVYVCLSLPVSGCALDKIFYKAGFGEPSRETKAAVEVDESYERRMEEVERRQRSEEKIKKSFNLELEISDFEIRKDLDTYDSGFGR